MANQELWAALKRLDGRLAAAIEAADLAYGREAAGDRFRGLHIGPADVARLLAREPGTPVLGRSDSSSDTLEPPPPSSPLDRLADRFGLTPFDRDIVIVALAPEVDLRYERLYAYLQDDVTRRRPSVDLALNLLCSSKEERLDHRVRFAADAPLLRHGLLRLVADPSQADPPLLAHALKLDDQVVRLLLGDQGLDGRLAGIARIGGMPTDGARPSIRAEVADQLIRLGRRARDSRRPLRLHFHGPDSGRRRDAASTVAAAAGMGMLVVDLAALPPADDAPAALRVALREAWWRGYVLHLEGCERLWEGEATSRWLRDLEAHDGLVILSSPAPITGRPRVVAEADRVGLLPVPLPAPGDDERQAVWAEHAREAGLEMSPQDLEALADTFRLTTDQIAQASALASATTSMRGEGERPGVADLFTAARECGAWDLHGMARRITPRRCWEDLVVPEDTLAQLRELCQRATHARRVLRDWRFDSRLTLGKGTTALFSGPSGTGKTMAAEVIAGALGLDLYKVDLSGVVSKWIGETEKNLDRVFRSTESGGGVVFFDEADALFGKRSEVRDSHDRYANVEISYLLQRMEEYEGVAILATNLRANLDDAFLRRLSFVVHFPFPTEAARLRIWERIWPEQVPMQDIDVARLAHELPLTGGHIKNVALAAAYLSAADGGVVQIEHVHQAVRREFQKLGKEQGRNA
jgi:hypothetical protein